MKSQIGRFIAAFGVGCILTLFSQHGYAQSDEAPPEIKALDDAAKQYILTKVDREDRVWIPMRDGIRLSATLLFEKDRPREKMPVVLYFNPYRTDQMIQSNARYFSSFLQNGYAVAVTSTRGRYFSEGTYTFLVGSGKDGYDTIDWLSKQRWSNGKVGTLGCSSSAEEQHKMNSMQHPALGAAVPIGSGAGIGRVGPYNEMGNFYRGGTVQNFWYSWYRGYGYKYKPSFPANMSQAELQQASRYWNLEPDGIPETNFDEKIWTLPINRIMAAVGAMPSDMDDFVNWLPNDARWNAIEFGGEGDRSGAPTLYINSWYDVSIGPNTAMYEYQSRNAANATARNNMFMVIAPTLHCNQGRIETQNTIVGERNMGDARFDYVGLVQRWFDRWLKGIDNGMSREPKIRVYTMGVNQWRTFDSWPPRKTQAVAFYLDSDGSANTNKGDGRLVRGKSLGKELSDRYSYDPLRPAPSVGGQVCCFAAAKGGAYDQSAVNSRDDVLVYTTPPLTRTVEVTGPVQVTLYVSSDAKDTDLMVNLIDVHPDGRAFNLDKGVLRLRWREGYTTPVFMKSGEVYKVDLPPLVTSNAFQPGHRIQIAITSSSFPQFERNLNTGGNNFDESKPVTARNVLHHGGRYPSRIVLPVMQSQD